MAVNIASLYIYTGLQGLEKISQSPSLTIIESNICTYSK